MLSGELVPVRVLGGRQVIPELGARAYLATECNPGAYNSSPYLALDLLGKSLRYTADVSGLGCGCNAALYLSSMQRDPRGPECLDPYCGAAGACWTSCAEIDLQQANMHAWHSALHSRAGRSGLAAGYGGGGDGRSGPRNWTASEYGPGAVCIDTTQPFEVAASFPVDAHGSLAAVTVTLSQPGRVCPLSVTLGSYPGMGELSSALRAGMTPMVSYQGSKDLGWLDGRGADSRGPCDADAPWTCADRARFYDFSLQCIEGRGGGGCRPGQPRASGRAAHVQQQLRARQACMAAHAWQDVASTLVEAFKALAAGGHAQAGCAGSMLLAVGAAVGLVSVLTGVCSGLDLIRGPHAGAGRSSEQLLAMGVVPRA